MWLMLCRLEAMGQAAFADGYFLDPFASVDDGPVTQEVDVGECEVAKAFVISAMVVALDEGADGGLDPLRPPQINVTMPVWVLPHSITLQQALIGRFSGSGGLCSCWRPRTWQAHVPFPKFCCRPVWGNS